MAQAIEAAAENIVGEFQQEMAAVMDNLEKAELAFDDLSGERRGTRCHPVSLGDAGELWVHPMRGTDF